MSDDEKRQLLVRELSSEYGHLIGGAALRKLLGFSSAAAMRQAICRRTLSLPTFFVEGRRGRFAVVTDVADWLIQTKAAGLDQSAIRRSNLPR